MCGDSIYGMMIQTAERCSAMTLMWWISGVIDGGFVGEVINMENGYY